MLFLSLSVTESALAFPQGLSFFNVLAGGSANGSKLLLHSNSDWGQDLVRLKERLDGNPQGSKCFLTYWGPCSPNALTIPALLRPPHDRIEGRGGWWFISRNCLQGDFRNVQMDKSVDASIVARQVSRLANEQPDILIGDSIVGFRVDRVCVQDLIPR